MGDFEDYWVDLRQGLGRGTVAPDSLDIVSIAVLHKWAQDVENQTRPPLVVVSGTNREILYRRVQSEDWMFERPGNILDLDGPYLRSWIFGATKHLVERVRDLTIPPEFRDKTTFLLPLPDPRHNSVGWEILWGLIACSFLVVDDPLDVLIDQRFSLLSDAHRGLLEARFAAMESHDIGVVETAVRALGAWVEGQKHSAMRPDEQAFLARANITQSVTDPERFEMLHFLLTLARQNGLLGSVVLAIDGIENLISKDVADELHRLIETSERWVRYGSPLGLIAGWRGTKQDAKDLKKVHTTLARVIIDSDRLIQRLSQAEG